VTPSQLAPMKSAAALLLALAALPACTAQVEERSLLRPVPGGTLTQDAVAQAAPAYTVTAHMIAAPDGAKLHAVLLRQPGARGTVIYFGGNGYTIGRFGALTAALFAPLGVDLLLVDHRGYGLSEGTPTAAALETDGLAVFDYLAALPGSRADRIVVHGQSLGSFIAGHIAGARPTAGVVLESSVTTTEDWAAAQAKGMPVKVAIAPSLRGLGNQREMPRIEEPVLLLVGSADKTTPPALSEALYRASPLPPERKTLQIADGAGHNDVMTKADAIAAYQRFLAQVFR
jgi:fermentation-respiration switch protein FrsA (DUF1100 family)